VERCAMNKLEHVRVAILVTDGFEQAELTEPKKALDQAGVKTSVVSPNDRKVRGWKTKDWGDEVDVDMPLAKADANAFDALLLPGGVINPDHLRMNPSAVAFVKQFFEAKKPVAAICHGPWMVIESGAAKGRRLASWPSLQTDVRNAGGQWVDEEVVVDDNLITSRKPDDIPAFNRALLERLGRIQAR
jgi:protease I